VSTAADERDYRGLTDEELLRHVYLGAFVSPLVTELALRLEARIDMEAHLDPDGEEG
jgi:hypothetical protein